MAKGRASRRLTIPKTRRVPRPANARVEQRLARIEQELAKLVKARVNAGRSEHDPVLDALRDLKTNTESLERHAHELEVQFKRIAQIQAELDEIKRAWQKGKR